MMPGDSDVATISVKHVESVPRRQSEGENGDAVSIKTAAGAGNAEGTFMEEALILTENGKFYYMILLCSGVVFLATGLENGLNAYILPSCKCDFDLTSTQMGMLNAVFLAGGMSSSYLAGFVADTYGRRFAIVGAMVGDSICSLLAAMAPNYTLLSVLRFLSGFCSGGPAAIVFLYISEYLPQPRRAPSCLLVGLFWTISWMLLPALSWIILPSAWPHLLPIPISPWRVFVASMIPPSLFAAFFVYKLPEAPQYLHARGRSVEAVAVLAKMFAWNTGMKESEYPVKVLAISEADKAAKAAAPPPSKSALSGAIRTMRTQLGSLFKQPVLPRTLIAFSATFFNMFTYYGLALWLPELLSRFEAHHELNPNRTVTVCELTRIYPIELAESLAAAANASHNLGLEESFDSEAACNHAAVNVEVFIETLIISAACLVANLISAILAPYVGRRTMPICLNMVGAGLTVALYFISSNVSVLVVASLFQAAMNTCNNAINGVMVDMFPPAISALGVVSAILAGRLGAAISNVVLGTLIDIACEVPIALLGTAAALSAFLCFFMQRPWAEIADDGSDYKSIHRRRSTLVNANAA